MQDRGRAVRRQVETGNAFRLSQNRQYLRSTRWAPDPAEPRMIDPERLRFAFGAAPTLENAHRRQPVRLLSEAAAGAQRTFGYLPGNLMNSQFPILDSRPREHAQFGVFPR